MIVWILCVIFLPKKQTNKQSLSDLKGVPVQEKENSFDADGRKKRPDDGGGGGEEGGEEEGRKGWEELLLPGGVRMMRHGSPPPHHPHPPLPALNVSFSPPQNVLRSNPGMSTGGPPFLVRLFSVRPSLSHFLSRPFVCRVCVFFSLAAVTGGLGPLGTGTRT